MLRLSTLLFGVFVAAASLANAQNSGTFTGRVSIEGRTVLRQQVPQSLYGANLEWIHNLWGAWDSWSNALSPRAAAATKSLSPSVLRFPGGTFSDFYHWKNGVGALSSRPPAPVTSGSEMSWNGFGTDEALALANSVGARLLITVNVGTGTPEEAADWVRYVNAKGTRVRDWELGNELYARTLSQDAAKITMPPDVYAQRVKQFARAMKAVDPAIRIGAIGGENTGPLPVVEYPDWNKIVLQQAGSDIDFLAVHNSYAPVMGFDRNENLETVYRAMLAAPDVIRQSLDRISTDIDRYAPPEHRDRIRIAVTEWGPLFHFSPLSRFVDHHKTLGSALFTASTLMTFIEHPRVESAHFFKLADNSFSGLLGIRNGDWQETAPLYALQLFRSYFGTRLTKTSVVSPTFQSDAVGIVPATVATPYLQAVSSLSEDGKRLFVIVVNKHMTDAADVDFDISGFSVSQTAVVRTLRGTGIDANTGTQLPYPDQIPWARQTQATSNPRFELGAPGEVGFDIATQTTAAQSRRLLASVQTFRRRIPAASVTAFEIQAPR